MEAAFAWVHSYGYPAVFLVMMLGIVGLSIRDETVFLFVGYQRVQGA